jgi:hypothetical protein
MRLPPAMAPRLMAVAVGLFFALGIIEVGLRLRGPGEHRSMTADAVLHHRLKPHLRARVGGVEFNTNSLGLRDREIVRPKPAGVFRVLMLGDSFTEGGGLPIETTVAKRVEAAVNGHGCRTTVEVVNAGVASYSPILEYLQLKHVGLALQPDLVVLNFDMTDVHDDWVRTAMARLDSEGLPVSVPSERRPEAALLMPPLRKPAFLRFLDPIERGVNRLALYQELRRTGVGEFIFGPLRLTPERMAALGLEGDPQYDLEAITRDRESPKLREAWRATERYIAATNRLARTHGAAFALVVYPHAQQVAADASPAGRRRHGLGPGLFESTRPFDTLEELGRREGFPVINLLALFRVRERPADPLFRADDIHHTKAGARVFAEGVVEGLDRLELVPCRRPIR